MERGSPIFVWFTAFINEKSIPLVFMCKGTDVFMDFMVDMFIVFMFLLCWLYAHFMTTIMYGFQQVFTFMWMDNVIMQQME